MATETTDPRVGLIVRVGILSIGTLMLVHAGVNSYFDRMVRAETYRKVGSLKPDALMSLRADERQRLSSGAMPIDKSMELLAAKGRMGAGPAIAPSASKDIAPMQGWMQMPAEVPPTMMEATPAPAAGSTAPSAASAPSAAPSGAPSAASSAGRAPGAPRPPASSNAPPHP